MFNNSHFSGGEGSNDPTEKLERVIKDRSNLNGLWVYTDRQGKPIIGVMRGEGIETGKAYVPFTVGQPDSLEDRDRALAEKQPFRASWIEDGNMSAAFRQVHGIADGRCPPYRLFDLLALRRASNIRVVEGERDAENLWRIGLPATSMFGTATAASHHDWQEALAGQNVVVINDADYGGLSRARDIVRSISALPLDNTPASLHVLPLEKRWPDCPKHGDITDFLDAQANKLDEIKRQADINSEGMSCGPMAKRWAALSRCAVSPKWQDDIVAVYRGKSDGSGGASIAGVGDVGMGDTRGHPDDEELLAHLKKAWLRLEQRLEESDVWERYANAEMLLSEHKRKEGRLHGYFRMSYGLKNKPVVAKDFGGAVGIMEYSLEDFATEMSDIKGLEVEGLRGPKAINIARYMWDNPTTTRYVFQQFDPDKAKVWTSKSGQVFNSYIPPHAGPPALDSYIPEGPEHPLTFWAKTHAPNGDDAEIMMSFFSLCVQYPAGPTRWALMFISPQGSGKGTIKSILMHACDNGTGNMAVIIPDNLDQNFTEELRNKTMVFVDEASNASTTSLRKLGQVTKTTITEREFTFKVKYVSSRGMEPNHCKWMVVGNGPQAAKLMVDGENDRRWAYVESVFKTKDEAAKAFELRWWRETHPVIYAAAVEHREAGGKKTNTWYDVFYHWLLAMDGLEDCRQLLLNRNILHGHGDAPETSCQASGVIENLPEWLRVLKEANADGEIPLNGDVIPMSAAINYLAKQGIKGVPGARIIGKELHQIGFIYKGRIVIDQDDCKLINITDKAGHTHLVDGERTPFYSKSAEHEGRGALMRRLWAENQRQARTLNLQEARYQEAELESHIKLAK
jgi:hypothetical protein